MAATGNGFERYLNVRSAWGASFSPDGSRLAFLSDITGVAEAWTVPVAPGADYPAWPDQITFRGERAQSATFAPNRETLLLAGDTGGTENSQLFLVNADGAGFSDLTGRPDVIYQFGGWSPDGERICFACNARDRRYFDVYERPATGEGEPRLLLQADATNYAARYAPDGAAVLVERHDSNVRTTLILVDRMTGAARTLTPDAGDAHAQYASAAWSAGRDSLYLLSDRGRDFMSLASLDLATLELTYLRDDHWDAEALAVSADGARLALVLNEDGYSRLELFDVSGGWDARRPLPAPDLPFRGELREPVWSPDGRRLAFTLDAPDANPDVWVWDVEGHALQRATRSARGGLAPDALVAPALVHFPTFDGRQIPAFLFLPRGAEPKKRLPAVLYVHGGPESQFRPMFHPIVQYFVNEGYAVLAPNVRGSSGYGYTYQSLDDIRLRMDSVADLKYAAAWLAESGIADAQRIAIWGRSYGGFMVLAAVTTYPEVWAAGVDIVGIANFVTFLENTGPWRRRLRESEYGSLEHDRDFLEDISPIHKVDRITAPMFVIHGANDPRVPVGEAEQIVAALRARNVPVEYLRFEDEGHQFAKRSTNLATYPAVARFLDRHMRRE